MSDRSRENTHKPHLITTPKGNLDEFGVCNIQHRLSIDGQIIAYNGSGLFNYTFGSPRIKNVQVRSNCQNCATWNFQYDSLYISANPQPPVTALHLTPPGTHYINAYVEMPTMVFAAQAIPSDLPLSYLTFHWYLTIDHTQNGRTSTQVRIPASGTVDIQGDNVWVPD